MIVPHAGNLLLPDYMDGIEPHWSKIRPFVLNSSEQFQPEPPPSFSMEPESPFYKELLEVYQVVRGDSAK